jgi:hypothetical protein
MTRFLAIAVLLAGCTAHVGEPYYPGDDMSVHEGALEGWKAPVALVTNGGA